MNLSREIIAVVILVVVIGIIFIILEHRPRTLNVEYFKKRWQELQKLCANRATWALAIIDADKLLDEALKKSHFKGKTMGERLVSAQHTFTNNDSVWFGHKLRNKIVHETDAKLRQKDVRAALVGFRQALKDLRAL
ncbi:MAG: hypothetical protein ABSB12_01160 [Candidatus Saccharimonadales bacterium]|jgi:hypothetical protein